MAQIKPLVFKDGQLQQLQGSDELDIVLEERVACLEQTVAALLAYGLANGWELPPLSSEEVTMLLEEGCAWT